MKTFGIIDSIGRISTCEGFDLNDAVVNSHNADVERTLEHNRTTLYWDWLYYMNQYNKKNWFEKTTGGNIRLCMEWWKTQMEKLQDDGQKALEEMCNSGFSSDCTDGSENHDKYLYGTDRVL